MTIRRAIAEIIAKGRGGERWNPTIDDDESSILILEHIKKNVPVLEWKTQKTKRDLVSDPYRLCFRADGTYGVFYHMSFIGAGTLEDAKSIAQQWDKNLKTGWML